MSQPDPCFDTQIHDVLPQRKKKETKYAIYFFYVQRIPRYSAFWTENPKCFQKCKMGMSHVCVN
jgi:hypothetical protein